MQSKGNKKTSVIVRISSTQKYYPDFVIKIQSYTQYQLQIFNHEFLDNFILGNYQLFKLIFE